MRKSTILHVASIILTSIRPSKRLACLSTLTKRDWEVGGALSAEARLEVCSNLHRQAVTLAPGSGILPSSISLTGCLCTGTHDTVVAAMQVQGHKRLLHIVACIAGRVSLLMPSCAVLLTCSAFRQTANPPGVHFSSVTGSRILGFTDWMTILQLKILQGLALGPPYQLVDIHVCF